MALTVVVAVVFATPMIAAAFTPSGCNPLADPTSNSCMLPWPSDHFLSTTWNATASPQLAYLANETFPADNSGKRIGVEAGGWTSMSGFSPTGYSIAHMPGIDIDASALPRHWNVSASVDASARSLLLAVDSGAQLLHWVEMDHSDDRGTTSPYLRATIMWPAGRLNDSTRYIVAYRNILDETGARIQSSPGFAALRDNTPSSSPDVEASRPRFEAIFSALASAGWERSSLTQAWDFTTATKADITGRLVSIRDDGFKRATYRYVISTVQENPRDGIARQIQGTFEAPCYLQTILPEAESRFVLDDSGLPTFQSYINVSFTVAIPNSVANGTFKDASFVQYGHGLFGSQGEVETGYLSSWADQYGYVLAAVDEIGLSAIDEPAAALILATDLTLFGYVPDRCQQGLLHELLATRLVTQSAFRNDASMTYRGGPIVSADPTRWHYYGNSQGGILGTVYMAATTDVTRGVIGVGGGPYSLLLPRSSDFSTLFAVLRLRYPHQLDAISMMAIMGALWDRAEPGGYLRAISDDPLPGTPAHRVIFQHGLADAQVSWLGVRYASFSTGAAVFASNAGQGNESLAHFRTVPDNAVVTSGNVAMTWDFGAPSWAAPLVNMPPVNDTWDSHEGPRRQATSQAQMAEFFATGRITNTCGGRCVAPHAFDGITSVDGSTARADHMTRASNMQGSEKWPTLASMLAKRQVAASPASAVAVA